MSLVIFFTPAAPLLPPFLAVRKELDVCKQNWRSQATTQSGGSLQLVWVQLEGQLIFGWMQLNSCMFVVM